MCLEVTTKALSTLLGNTPRDELYGIDSRLRVLTSIKSVLRNVDKEFSLCTNYTKGHGEIFHMLIDTNHLGALLLNAKRA